ncbi:MAG: hypothetical protein K0R63_300 [Rickettsiales bacterium]|jgi:hypothetical protein|nr:hypothetical protein [Rickettsiales bacterium]
MRYIKIRLILGIMMLLLIPSNGFSQEFSENEVKAVFFYKIAKFIRWETQGKLVLCSMGESNKDPTTTVGKYLEDLAKGNQEKYRVLRNVSVNDVKSCHMLFLANGAKANLEDILAVSQQRSIVTVSDIEGFLRRGGMFQFSIKSGNKVSVELNYTNARASNININSALLEMIKVVE